MQDVLVTAYRGQALQQVTSQRGLPSYAEVVQDIAYFGLGCGLEKIHRLWSSPPPSLRSPFVGTSMSD